MQLEDYWDGDGQVVQEFQIIWNSRALRSPRGSGGRLNFTSIYSNFNHNSKSSEEWIEKTYSRIPSFYIANCKCNNSPRVLAIFKWCCRWLRSKSWKKVGFAFEASKSHRVAQCEIFPTRFLTKSPNKDNGRRAAFGTSCYINMRHHFPIQI